MNNRMYVNVIEVLNNNVILKSSVTTVVLYTFLSYTFSWTEIQEDAQIFVVEILEICLQEKFRFSLQWKK